ncbi:unnamed protein product [Microthlaspi erraticum]|uniref:Uncharacterized protein n=1 Tax=Microthlaspi erraticum TaxID=1685480 RepID=A0A6D2I8W6_9BRAS|nr:unnamed protein product [Microthlaspi erraticum]
MDNEDEIWCCTRRQWREEESSRWRRKWQSEEKTGAEKRAKERETEMVEGRENWFRATNRGRGRSSGESVAVYLLGALLILTAPDSRVCLF